jgi:hypothetical protein
VRVNITYSIELEEVPEEMENLIQRLKDKSVSQFNQKLEELLHNLSVGDEPTALQLIPEIREEMIDIDQRLGECFNILESYVGISSESEEEKDG